MALGSHVNMVRWTACDNTFMLSGDRDVSSDLCGSRYWVDDCSRPQGTLLRRVPGSVQGDEIPEAEKRDGVQVKFDVNRLRFRRCRNGVVEWERWR